MRLSGRVPAGMMGAPVPRPLPAILAAAALALTTGAVAAAPAAAADRPAGSVTDWSHELNQEQHPRWREATAPPFRPAVWRRMMDEVLTTAGSNGLWFGGVSALPFPPLPLSPKETTGWRTPRNFMAKYRATGLKWDVAVEVWAARNALNSKRAVVSDPKTLAWTRRLSLLDPAYRTAALKEIRRIVPTVRNKPYVNYYTGSDEPFPVLPRGKARRTPFGRSLAADFRRATGYTLPDPLAKRSSSQAERLRWTNWSRYSGRRFFAMKAEQARLIKRLDPAAVVNPNDYGFIDGFIPWDYSRLAEFADVVEADPYVSYPERDRAGRGRYNPGFGAKLMSDLTGKRTRIVVQAFNYSRYTPTSADLWTWTAQALRAGATDISFFASDNPRFTRPRFYQAMLDVARSLRGARLPAPPTDPRQLVLYSTASEGQAQPDRVGDPRYRTSGDAIYTTYSLLGELEHASFSFDSDERLMREPQRLAAARTVWMPRGSVLDAPFADQLVAWVRAGGTLIVTDPDAFTTTPAGTRHPSLAAQRDALIGASVGPVRTGTVLEVQPGALGAGVPDDLLDIPIDSPNPRAFASVPADATVVARFLDGAPAAILRQVGAGRVLAFSADPMAPGVLDGPMDLARFVGDVHEWAGGTLGDPAWTYRIPGDPDPGRLPWPDAITPEAAQAGM